MKIDSQFLRRMPLWDAASIAILALVGLLVVTTFQHYGSGFDAEVQDNYGQQIVSWYLSLGRDKSALTYLDLYYYGGLFDMLAALANLISPFGHWATRHLLEALFGIAGLAGSWRLARHLGGPSAGFLALAALALMPSYYGMMFINPKDIPFAALMIWALYFATRIAETLPQIDKRLIAAFGLLAGLTLGVRIGGVLLFGYLGLVITAQAVTARSIRCFITLGLTVMLPSLAIAWAVMLVFWPWALVAPITHPFEALRHFAAMQNNIDTLFFGHEVSRHYHPAYYLPVYLAIKLPDIVLVMLAVAAVTAIQARRNWSLKLLPILLGALFPIGYALATGPELYDADRHFLFVLPPLAVLGGLATSRLPLGRAPRWASIALVLLFAAGGARQVAAMVDLHPYEYAFFNDSVGGTAGARGLFETEYWGASLAEATSDLGRYIVSHHLDHHAPWRLAFCGQLTQMGDQHFPELQPTNDWKHADFFIASTRGGCDRRLPGREIGEVDRDGVPFAVVKDMRKTLATPKS